MSADASGVTLNRRALITSAVAAGGGWLIGVLPRAAQAAPAPATALAPNAFIRIDRRGQVTLLLPYVEMGQGAYTSQVQVLAEELEVSPTAVAIEHAPPGAPYASPLFGEQITGGSGSLRGTWRSMRTAGAAARTMLVQAAADRWRVAPATCLAENGVVVHPATRRRLRYGELAEAAARIEPPKEPALKPRSSYKVIGQPMRRVDTPAKVDGSAKYAIDVRLPGLRHAAVMASPVFNGKVRGVDATAAMKIRGVRQVVRLADAVAVVADSTWAARKGLHALKIDWDEGANATLSTADLVARADAALDRPGLVFARQGDADAAEAGAASRYEAVFRLPMLAHAALEPLSCTADVRADRCEVWCGSQTLGRAQKVAADLTRLPLERVVVHNHLLGGGFGRRLESDYVAQAVLIAKQVSGPVKVTWSREEDMRQDYFRGHNHSRVTVGLDAAGRPASWRHRVVGPNIMARFLPVYQRDGIDLDIVNGASGPYDIAHRFVDFTRHEAPEGLRTGNWRGVGPTRNVFIVESVMDDLALRAGMDPLAYRRSLMKNAPERLRKLVDLAAEKSSWGTPLPGRRGRGIAMFGAFDSFFAIVAQASVADSGEITVEQVVCAADVGQMVNPDIVRAQLEGGVVFGVSAALFGRITVADGRVQQGNFDTYPVVRMREAPRVECVLVDNDEEPGGVGEPGTAGAIAAVANAVAAATGKRAYALPLDPALFRMT